MKEIEFTVPRKCDLARAELLIEKICARRGLVVSMKGTQSRFPGCIHWHLKLGKQSGTLELTLFIRQRRIWAKVQEGRKAAWIDEELPQLRRAIENKLKALSS